MLTEIQEFLLDKAKKDIEDWLILNNLKETRQPEITLVGKMSGRYCGLFWVTRTNIPKIKICPAKCSNIAKIPGYGWSHPHYPVDRTLYGVFIHEFGHFIDYKLNNYDGVPKHLNEKVTNYEPDDNERFAEGFKLFISNPDLFAKICPHRYKYFTEKMNLKPLNRGSWEYVMRDLHPKYINAIKKRIQNFNK